MKILCGTFARIRKIGRYFFLGLTFLQSSLLANSQSPFSENSADLLIGYTELRTNLQGGRQANVATMRAMIVKPDGSGRKVLAESLTQGTDTMTQFAGWSPDGKKAIIGRGWKSIENASWEETHRQFRNVDGQVIYDNYLVDISGGSVTNVTSVERISCYNSGLFFWPNDSSKLGFTALINGISHPFKMDIDGRNKVDLTKGSNDFTYGFNASKDGKRIAYHKDYQVYIANSDGSDPLLVATGNHFNFGPQWSPDGAWLLFVSGERNTKCNPYLVKADGTAMKKLADRGGYKGSVEFLDVYDFHEGSSDIPVWSADGQSVFYTTLIGETVELFQTGLDGKSKQLTKSKNGTLHYHPEPSPDGKYLLYGSKRDGIRQLFVMRLSDHTEHPVTNLEFGHAAMWAHWQPKNSLH